MHWYEKNIMGTGPFKFVEHVKGSHVVGKKNPDYWDKGKPYLDGFRAVFVSSSSAQVAMIRGERAHIQFRGFSPAERDSLVQALGQQDHRPGEPLGLHPDGRRSTTRRSPSTTSACAGRSRSRSTATRGRRRCRRSPS